MKRSSSIVGEQAGPLEHRVDARWVMAYNAGLGERSDHYLAARPDPAEARPDIHAGERQEEACAADQHEYGA